MSKENGTTVNDEDIIALYFARNEDAISHTQVKYGAYLYTIAENIVHNRMDCEECVNDTYLGAWNSIPPQRPRILRSFLAQITRRVSIDRYRAGSAAKRMPGEFTVSVDELVECLGGGKDPEEQTELAEITRVMNEYLHTLSDYELGLFVSRYYCATR